jgi:hypothetical protein
MSFLLTKKNIFEGQNGHDGEKEGVDFSKESRVEKGERLFFHEQAPVPSEPCGKQYEQTIDRPRMY